MPDPTPGEIAYAAYCHSGYWKFGYRWAALDGATQALWEAAAQAVLSAAGGAVVSPPSSS